MYSLYVGIFAEDFYRKIAWEFSHLLPPYLSLISPWLNSPNRKNIFQTPSALFWQKLY